RTVLDLLVRVFPFMLVMWSSAGALYPAVDLCAGEKERGTMETLLISPASREEIVLGKFLTIWVFSAATALLNLASMGLTTWQFGGQLPQGTLTPLALFWCVVLSLPLSAFFRAIGQFQREEVLFREAERLDLGLYLRRLFREKEPLPTTGQALFCFGLLLVLRWLSLGLGSQLPLLVRTFIVQTALVAAPPLFMA